MKRLRIMGTALFVAAMVIGCTNDIVTDKIENEEVKTFANRKRVATEHWSDEKPDTTYHYEWLPLDTTIIETVCVTLDVSVHFSCNGGHSSELHPTASITRHEYDIIGAVPPPTTSFLKCELGNNGSVHCRFLAGTQEYIVTANLKPKKVSHK